MAPNTPFRLYKGFTHAGGVRVPFVLSWPKGIDEHARGQVRREYQYVTDLLPTLLELTGVERPSSSAVLKSYHSTASASRRR